MVYNTTGIEAANDTLQLINAENAMTGGILGGAILLTIWVVSFAASKKYDTSVAAITASTITGVTAVLFYFIGFVKQEVMVVPIVMLFAAIFYHQVKK